MSEENRIRKIIAASFSLKKPIGKIKNTEKLNNLGMDSISFVELIVELEDEFKITFPAHYLSIQKVGTIKSLCNAVKRLHSKKTVKKESVRKV